MKKETYAFIFARKSSKRLKNKNIKKLNGLELINYSIFLAKKISSVSKIFVSTDDYRIKKISLNQKCIIINRPKRLATDKASEWKAWKHAVEFVKKNYNLQNFNFLSLPTTTPLRSKNDILETMKLLKNKTDIVLTCFPSRSNPAFNMIVQQKNGFFDLYNKDKKIHRFQDAPRVFDITTAAYYTTSDYIVKNKSMLSGNVMAYEMPHERAVDIDNYIDFFLAEQLIKQKIIKIKF
jgi:N-acylneuraminate cytidylyltransferase